MFDAWCLNCWQVLKECKNRKDRYLGFLKVGKPVGGAINWWA